MCATTNSSGSSRTRSFSSAFDDTKRMLVPSAAAVREAACPVACAGSRELNRLPLLVHRVPAPKKQGSAPAWQRSPAQRRGTWRPSRSSGRTTVHYQRWLVHRADVCMPGAPRRHRNSRWCGPACCCATAAALFVRSCTAAAVARVFADTCTGSALYSPPV